jgi:hypothetical protein
MDTLSILKNHLKGFIPFSDAELNIAENFFRHVRLKKGQLLEDIIGENTSIAFVMRGTIRMFFVKNEQEQTFQLLIDNQWAIPSYPFAVHDKVEAIEDSELMIISKANFQYLCDRFPRWERLGRILSEQNIISYESRIRSFVSDDAQERYQRVFNESPELVKRVPQVYLANFLGITPESLSRLRRKIKIAQQQEEMIAFAVTEPCLLLS